jgi:hypothetical protein
MSIRTTLLRPALAIMLGLVAVPAVAQAQQSDTMQVVRDEIRTDKKLLIAKYMHLTEKEAKVFWPIYDGYEKGVSKINDRALKLIRDYASNYQTMSDQTAKKLMDEYLAIEAARQKLRQAYVPRLRKVLPEKLVARFFQLENKIQAAVNYDLAAEIPLVK